MSRKIITLSGLVIIGIGVCGANSSYLLELIGIEAGIKSPPPTTLKAIGSIQVAFSPNNGVTNMVVNAIDSAKKSILVEAYSFTSKDIANSLLAAKNRGVAVNIILDKSQVSQQYSSSRFFANQGFMVKIDNKHAIFHNKVMIIDDKTVITGSFNFTKAAEAKNAENLLILNNNPELAKLYTQDWLSHWQHSINQQEFELSRKTSKAKSKYKTAENEDATGEGQTND